MPIANPKLTISDPKNQTVDNVLEAIRERITDINIVRFAEDLRVKFNCNSQPVTLLDEYREKILEILKDYTHA